MPHTIPPPLCRPKAAIFPGYVAPIVRKAADGERELVNLNRFLQGADGWEMRKRPRRHCDSTRGHSGACKI